MFAAGVGTGANARARGGRGGKRSCTARELGSWPRISPLHFITEGVFGSKAHRRMRAYRHRVTRRETENEKRAALNRRSSPSTTPPMIWAFLCICIFTSIATIDILTILPPKLYITDDSAFSQFDQHHNIVSLLISHFFFSSLPLAVYNSSLFRKNQVN
jgi:hypothetical protein